ncbi:MAG: 1-acyl-sn-glycerol-3-phosphate acyltransferase [Verrucomicrobiales bacterium]
MDSLVSDQRYVFTPPKRSTGWTWFVATWVRAYLRRAWGLEKFELHGLDHLRESLRAGHGILLAPNHCRLSDPPALGVLVQALRQPIYIMASAHVFREGWFHRFMLPRIGAFSVNREGMDREALKVAIEILSTADRPLVVFPEGVTSRTNDRLIPLQDGVAFLARSAAKARAALTPPGHVVIHPIALRYHFRGDVESSLEPVLSRLEANLSWQPRTGVPLRDRIAGLGRALLTMKEMEFHGEARIGPTVDRLAALREDILRPLEQQWLGARAAAASEDTVIIRVKNLRKSLLPDLIENRLSPRDRTERWRQIQALAVAEQTFHFPPDYLGDNPTPERLIETVERYEEAFGNPYPTVHRPMHLTFTVGPAIPVPSTRDKRTASDPLMDSLAASLRQLLGISSSPSPP